MESLNHGKEKIGIKPPDSDTQKTDSLLKMFSNTFISFIGAGILGLPAAFSQAGVLLGTVIFVIVAFLSLHCMYLILELQEDFESQGVHKYGDIGYVAYGKTGFLLVEISVVVSQVGFCVAYLIFISGNLEHIFGFSTTFWIYSLAPPLVLLCWIKLLKELAFTSLIADIANALGLFTILLLEFSHILSSDPSTPPPDSSSTYHMDNDSNHITSSVNQTSTSSTFNSTSDEISSSSSSMTSYEDIDNSIQLIIWSSVPVFFGTAVYCYEGVTLVVELKRSYVYKAYFPWILNTSMIFITSLYIFFGLVGYISFGTETKSIITLNLTQGISANLVQLCICTGLFFTYPMMMFPVWKTLEPMIDINDEKKRKIFRFFVVFFSSFVASVVPDFGLFISFVGASCCSALALIFPSLFHLKLKYNKLTFLEIIKNWILALIGFGVAAFGTLDALQKLHEHPDNTL